MSLYVIHVIFDRLQGSGDRGNIAAAALRHIWTTAALASDCRRSLLHNIARLAATREVFRYAGDQRYFFALATGQQHHT